MKGIFKKIIFGILFLILFFAGYFFIGSVKPSEKISWGVNFSQKQAGALDLDWREAYSALLNDLGAKQIKLITYWDLLEKENGLYYFDDLDWQIKEAEKYDAVILLAIGMKTPRWPECHIPEWAKNLSKEEQQSKILKLLEKIVLRYGRAPTPNFGVGAWQVENEPLFPFGECPEGVLNKSFLKKEVNLVKSLDPSRPVVISDTGEFSFWIEAARLGDIVGTTLHRKVWFKELGRYVKYPLRPIFYWRKAKIIDTFFHKDVFVGELQAEPWCLKYLNECPLSEQNKTMNLEFFKDNIEFAKNTGLSQHYLWGVEWMYWLKEKQNKPEIWQEAKTLFNNNLFTP